MTEDDFYGSSKTGEHYTQRFWWQLVIKTMGAIDVDPSSDPAHHIPAAVHYTKKEDGLRQQWNGRAYLNPEYGRDIIKWFIKLANEMEAGHCTEAIVLWKCALETKATEVLINTPQYKCSAVPKNRISFDLGENKEQNRNGHSATFTPIFHYFGQNDDKFIKIFGQHCTIWKPIKQGMQKGIGDFP
jgi:hypothetical protein